MHGFFIPRVVTTKLTLDNRRELHGILVQRAQLGCQVLRNRRRVDGRQVVQPVARATFCGTVANIIRTMRSALAGIKQFRHGHSFGL